MWTLAQLTLSALWDASNMREKGPHHMYNILKLGDLTYFEGDTIQVLTFNTSD